MKKNLRLAVLTMCLFSLLLSLFGCKIKDRLILDGPGMERTAGWTSFTVSKTADVYEENYAYTVTYNETDDSYSVSYEYFDYVNKVPEEKIVKLKSETINQLLAMNLTALPDVVEEPVDPEHDVMILDGTSVHLIVHEASGRKVEKVISESQADSIRDLLRPYVE